MGVGGRPLWCTLRTHAQQAAIPPHTEHRDEFASSHVSPCESTKPLPRESGEVRKHRGHEVAVMRVGRRETGRIQIEHVTHLGYRFRPRRGRNGKQLDFDDALLSRSSFALASKIEPFLTFSRQGHPAP